MEKENMIDMVISLAIMAIIALFVYAIILVFRDGKLWVCYSLLGLLGWIALTLIVKAVRDR